MSASDRRARLDRVHPELSIRRQCEMLGLARSGVYRKRRPANDNDLEAKGSRTRSVSNRYGGASTRCLRRGRFSARGGSPRR